MGEGILIQQIHGVLGCDGEEIVLRILRRNHIDILLQMIASAHAQKQLKQQQQTPLPTSSNRYFFNLETFEGHQGCGLNEA